MRVVLALSFLGINVFVGLWDIYCSATNQWQHTVSATLQDWGGQYPVLPLLAGILIGHIWWPHRQ